MNMALRTIAVVLLGMIAVSAPGAGAEAAESSNGISYPAGWTHWSAIGVTHRSDNDTLRLVLGNPVAVEAARAGKTNPWPDGAILAKVVWKDASLDTWKTATVPGQFVHAEFMFKDSGKYGQTGGWGWARWVGLDQKPFNDGPEICISCHAPVRDRDLVFAGPAPLPSPE